VCCVCVREREQGSVCLDPTTMRCCCVLCVCARERARECVSGSQSETCRLLSELLCVSLATVGSRAGDGICKSEGEKWNMVCGIWNMVYGVCTLYGMWNMRNVEYVLCNFVAVYSSLLQ